MYELANLNMDVVKDDFFINLIRKFVPLGCILFLHALMFVC